MIIREDAIYGRQSVDRKDSISIESQIESVSYTHLDVYKRQVSRNGEYSPGAPHLCLSQAEYPGADGGVSGGHRPFGAERGKAAAPRQPRGQIGRFWSRSVSYTHLDVYKRQKLN